MCPRHDATDIRHLFSALVDTASSSGSVAERTDRVARMLAGRVDLDEYPLAALDGLFDDIVYVVFNIPERIEDHINRLFTVIMNPSEVSVSNDLLTRIAANKGDRDTRGTDQAPVIYRTGAQVPQKRLDLISASWQRAWQEYAELTRNLQDRGVYTWNQYLLHGAAFPSPLGVIWSGDRNDEPPADYFELDAGILETIGVPNKLSPGTSRNDFMCELSRDRDLWDFNLSDDVVERWMNMSRDDETLDIQSCAKAGTYQLLRTYSCWGGNAFLSLPIIIAAGNGEGEASGSSRMVISVCSTRPLNDQEILIWESLGHFVFPQLASGDLVIRHQAVAAQRERFLLQTRNLAHEIKNHTNPIREDLDIGVHRLDMHHIDAYNDTKKIFAKARRRLLLTNATARAIQFAVDQASGRKEGKPQEELPLRPLRRTSVNETIEAILQQALMEISERRTDFTIRYKPVWNWEALKQGLLGLIPPEEHAPLVFYEDVLQCVVLKNRFVWVYALIREVLSNIKAQSAGTVIDLEYTIELRGSFVCLEITQRQIETNELTFAVPPSGVVTTNDIFGPEQADLGFIECGKIKNVKTDDGKYQFEFNVSIIFKVEVESL